MLATEAISILVFRSKHCSLSLNFIVEMLQCIFKTHRQLIGTEDSRMKTRE